MGGWKLEVFKMVVYISFPVGCFLVFNSPAFYEQAVLDGRRALAGCIDPKGSEALAKYIKQKQAEQFEQTIKDLKSRKGP